MQQIEPAQLTDWLTSAFAEQPGWIITDQKSVESFQQAIERVTLSWPETGATETVFVRAYHGLMSWWTLATPDLPQRELAAARVAVRAGVPTVETIWQSLAQTPSVVVQRLALGQSSPKPWTREMILDLAQTMARLHSAPITDEDRLHLPDISLPVLFARFRAWADEAKYSEGASAVDTLAAQFADIAERPPVLVHGDAHTGNFLFHPTEVAVVLDWEEAALGDPRIDVSLLAYCFEQDAPELAADFLACYEAQAGFALGPMAPWRELCKVRGQLVEDWIKYRLAHHLPIPSANPEVWVTHSSDECEN